MIIGESFVSEFLIDSGACANVISLKTWRHMRSDKKMSIIAFQWGNCRSLKAVNGSEVKVLGKLTAHIQVKDVVKPSDYEEILIVQEAIDNIISYKTATKMDILKVGINSDEMILSVKENTEFPYIPGLLYKLSVNPMVPPVRNTSYFVPLAYEEDLDKDLCDLERQGITEKAPVDSEWCHRVDSVKKQGGKGRRPIVDMRNANKALYRDNYQMPHPETIFPKLAGARYFTKLDLKNAFFHVKLHPDSRYITTFMTKRGMMQFTRLPFGMNVAPEAFQRIMQEILEGCEGCTHYIDDILIFAESLETLDKRTKTGASKEQSHTKRSKVRVRERKGHIPWKHNNGGRSQSHQRKAIKHRKIPRTQEHRRTALLYRNGELHERSH